MDKAIEEMRERAATFVPVEGRAAKDGDYALIKLDGHARGRRRTGEADNIICHIGAEETLESFTENLRGANPGETKNFSAKYPDDYPDAETRRARPTTTRSKFRAIKEKKLPELNDEFAIGSSQGSGRR